jgi:hypothetical protein
VSVQDFGAVLNGSTDDSTAIFNANAEAIAAKLPLLIPGVAHIASSITITAPLVDGLYQIFSTTSVVTINNGLPVRPEWFGMTIGAVNRAITSLPSTGGVIQLEDGTYPSNGYFVGTTGAGSGSYVSKDNVSIIGQTMPTPTTDCRALVGGSIIQGAFYAYANNFSASNVGFDNGNTYCTTNAVAPSDALALTYGNNALRAASALRYRANLHNVIGLCNGPNDAFHAVIAGEGYTNVTCTGDTVGMYGVHGVVIKCKNLTAQNIKAYLNYSDGVIIKSDSFVTDNSIDVQIESIISFVDGPDGYSPYALPAAADESIGVFFHAMGANISKIQIGQINERGHRRGVYSQHDGAYIIDSLQIGRIITDTNSEVGVQFLTFATNASFQRCQIGDIVVRNTPKGVITAWATSSSLKIGTVHAVNCSIAAVVTSGIAAPFIDKVIAESCTAVWEITSTKAPRVGIVSQLGAVGVLYSSTGGGQVPALSNGWTFASGQEPFAVQLADYGVRLKGLMLPGSSNTILTLPVAFRPDQASIQICAGLSGGGATQAAVTLIIESTGNVIVNPNTGGTANVADYMAFGNTFYSTASA